MARREIAFLELGEICGELDRLYDGGYEKQGNWDLAQICDHCGYFVEGCLEGFGEKFPWQLSGGMQQRASIARALAFDADILLMDEPFGALDEIVRDHLNEQLLALWDRTGKTIGFVTHSIPEAVYLSTKIVVMSPRPGRITDVIESTLPRERPLDIRDTPEFLAIAHRVREGLRAGHAYDD